MQIVFVEKSNYCNNLKKDFDLCVLRGVLIKDKGDLTLPPIQIHRKWWYSVEYYSDYVYELKLQEVK